MSERVVKRSKLLNMPNVIGSVFDAGMTKTGACWNGVLLAVARARSETVCAGMVYRRFFGRLEIIPPLVSGRLPYRCFGPDWPLVFTLQCTKFVQLIVR